MFHQIVKLLAGILHDMISFSGSTPDMRRLQNVDMNCGCDYSSIPGFRSSDGFFLQNKQMLPPFLFPCFPFCRFHFIMLRRAFARCFETISFLQIQ
jgi:hypothetical protein